MPETRSWVAVEKNGLAVFRLVVATFHPFVKTSHGFVLMEKKDALAARLIASSELVFRKPRSVVRSRVMRTV